MIPGGLFLGDDVGTPIGFGKGSRLREFRSALRLFVLGLIRFYQQCLSPVLPSFCRYYPSCSQYACEAVERWGPGRGLHLALRRVLRCRPWGGIGYDPVPDSGPEQGAL